MDKKIIKWEKEVEQCLINDNCMVKSQIEGLSDLIWSCVARTISPDPDVLKKWFYSNIPAFDNRIPMDILKEDGEEKLFSLVMTIPC